VYHSVAWLGFIIVRIVENAKLFKGWWYVLKTKSAPSAVVVPIRRGISCTLAYRNATWDFLSGSEYSPHCALSACHGSELSYLFQNIQSFGFNYTMPDMQLSILQNAYIVCIST
jgi:hypothetical protein